MPELPDIAAYLTALEARILHQPLTQVRLASPFLLRSVAPPLSETHGKQVVALERVGKRIAIGLENDLWLVIHLMIAGRLHWKKLGAKPAGRIGLAAFDFPNGTLLLTEAGTRKQASLRVVEGRQGLATLNPGGIEPLEATLDQFAGALRKENHTLKRTLTDPRIFSGIGNAYSDEILHAAQLSPMALSAKLSDADIEKLYQATQSTLRLWIERFHAEAREKFPDNVTAFRPEMAVHGKYKEPCPVCGSSVQRIRYASNECNYCATCQTGGKLLSDRSLSRLMRDDWPKTLEELEKKMEGLKK
jgi:formamidopyrimidine-DNA glycosylase